MKADELKASVSYDQTTVTPAENRIFKTVKDEPSQWLTDDSKQDKSIYENWSSPSTAIARTPSR